jgi:hypothetical protein
MFAEMVYKRSFRTNNDVEGWHNRINQGALAGGLNLYMLIDRLHAEAKDAAFTCQFVEDGILLRHQRKKYADLHDKIAKIWDEFSTGSMSPTDLLKKCSHLNGPSKLSAD